MDGILWIGWMFGWQAVCSMTVTYSLLSCCRASDSKAAMSQPCHTPPPLTRQANTTTQLKISAHTPSETHKQIKKKTPRMLLGNRHMHIGSCFQFNLCCSSRGVNLTREFSADYKS